MQSMSNLHSTPAIDCILNPSCLVLITILSSWLEQIIILSIRMPLSYNGGGCISDKLSEEGSDYSSTSSRTAITWFNWSALPLFGPLSGIVSLKRRG